MECRHCGSTSLHKAGIVFGKQRYRCNACKRTMRENDLRIKYTADKRLRVLKLYFENVGIRSIERLEGVPNTLIISWIRRSAEFINKLIKKEENQENPKTLENVEILEMDECNSFVKRNETESTYGLVQIGTKAGLLILRSRGS